MTKKITAKQVEEYRAAAKDRMKLREAEGADKQKRQLLELQLRREAIAAEKRSDLRDRAEQAYLGQGGSLADFNKGWEKMYEAIITQRTIDQVANPDWRPEGYVPLTLG